MKRLILAAIPCCLMFIAVTAVFCVQPAQAGYIVTLKKVGSDVIMTGSGAIDLTGLTFDPRVEGCCSAEMSPKTGSLILTNGNAVLYRGTSGPSSFGTGELSFASSFSGDTGGVVNLINPFFPFNDVVVPFDYISNNPLSGMSTYHNATFSSLGVTPGTYVWTWRTGLPNQNFTLIIGAARWRVDSLSARFRFARIGCFAAQVELRKGGKS